MRRSEKIFHYSRLLKWCIEKNDIIFFKFYFNTLLEISRTIKVVQNIFIYWPGTENSNSQ